MSGAPVQLHLLAERINAICNAQTLVLATAESCTGGQIAAALTALPGASRIFDRGFVTYSNDAKTDMLGVDTRLIQYHGAVSREVAMAMAQGALTHSRASISIAVTGIAGPTGASLEKPIGRVHIAVADAANCEEQLYDFGDIGRALVRDKASIAALEFLGEFISRRAA